MKRRDPSKNYVQNLFIDSNLLKRILRVGVDTALPKISSQLSELGLRTIEHYKTSYFFTPSNIFEFCGLQQEFLTADELKQVCEGVADPGEAPVYFKSVYDAIEERVKGLPILQSDEILKRLRDKLLYVPQDSRAVIKSSFIAPLEKNLALVRHIHQDAAFHLFCAARVLPKYEIQHHIYAAHASFNFFKKGQLGPIGKILPTVWDAMCRTDTAQEAYPGPVREKIKALISMHEVGDFCDSDLVHLAVMGVQRELSQPVYCFTEDPPAKLRNRVLLYKSMMTTMLQGFKKVDDRPGSVEFKGIDLKPGYVFVCDARFQIVDHFSVETLEKAEVPGTAAVSEAE